MSLTLSHSLIYLQYFLPSYLTVENEGLWNIYHTLPNLLNELRYTMDSSSSLLNKFGAVAVINTTDTKATWLPNYFMQWYWWSMKLICSRHTLQSPHTRLFPANTAKFLFKSLHLETDTFDIELVFMAELLKIPIVEVPLPVTITQEQDSNVLTFNHFQPVLLLDHTIMTVTMARDTLILRIAYLLEIWQIEMYGS